MAVNALDALGLKVARVTGDNQRTADTPDCPILEGLLQPVPTASISEGKHRETAKKSLRARRSAA